MRIIKRAYQRSEFWGAPVYEDVSEMICTCDKCGNEVDEDELYVCPFGDTETCKDCVNEYIDNAEHIQGTCPECGAAETLYKVGDLLYTATTDSEYICRDCVWDYIEKA